MAYYNTCIYCGAHLDPGEKCDCQRAVAARNGQAYWETPDFWESPGRQGKPPDKCERSKSETDL